MFGQADAPSRVSRVRMQSRRFHQARCFCRWSQHLVRIRQDRRRALAGPRRSLVAVWTRGGEFSRPDSITAKEARRHANLVLLYSL